MEGNCHLLSNRLKRIFVFALFFFPHLKLQCFHPFPTASAEGLEGCAGFICLLDLGNISKEQRTVTRAVEMKMVNNVMLEKEIFALDGQRRENTEGALL